MWICNHSMIATRISILSVRSISERTWVRFFFLRGLECHAHRSLPERTVHCRLWRSGLLRRPGRIGPDGWADPDRLLAHLCFFSWLYLFLKKYAAFFSKRDPKFSIAGLYRFCATHETNNVYICTKLIYFKGTFLFLLTIIARAADQDCTSYSRPTVHLKRAWPAPAPLS